MSLNELGCSGGGDSCLSGGYHLGQGFVPVLERIPLGELSVQGLVTIPFGFSVSRRLVCCGSSWTGVSGGAHCSGGGALLPGFMASSGLVCCSCYGAAIVV